MMIRNMSGSPPKPNTLGKIISDYLVPKRKLILAVANPPGEVDEKRAGTFRTQTELEELAAGMANGIPLFIEHNTTVDGKNVEPSGRVLAAKVGKNTKALYVLAELYDNQNGKLAESLIENPEIPFKEVSLGGAVLMKDEYDKEIDMTLPKPIARVTKEISLVFKGDRENCKILHYGTEDEILKEYEAGVMSGPI